MTDPKLNNLFSSHPRDWQANRYVYPVVSRRSGGVSIGINLNPDKACSFDCIYCQVDRTIPPKVRKVDLGILAGELDDMLARIADGRFGKESYLADLPEEYRRINDIAFSGDGEPTACPQFLEAVRLASEAKRRHGLAGVKVVLITDAAFLKRPAVRQALAVMDANDGEIWAKLDAGTEEYFRLVNRATISLETIIDNILDASRVRPVIIQSLWMRIHGQPPPEKEVRAFCERLTAMQAAGGRFRLVQVYTIARRTAESHVAPLTPAEVDAIADRVRGTTGLPAKVFYGRSD